MSERLFRFKGFEWEGVEPRLGEDGYPTGGFWCNTPFGSMQVGRRYDGMPHDSLRLQWSYCFDEYYDEGQHDCDTAEHGKAAAEAYFLERLSSMFEEVKP
jgi:hypothetical protein